MLCSAARPSAMSDNQTHTRFNQRRGRWDMEPKTPTFGPANGHDKFSRVVFFQGHLPRIQVEEPTEHTEDTATFPMAAPHSLLKPFALILAAATAFAATPPPQPAYR